MPADTASAAADGARGDFPQAFYSVIRWIDGFSDITGKLIALSMLFLVASITYEVVARFLAVLELYREGRVTVDQLTPLGELYVSWSAAPSCPRQAGGGR